MDMWRQQGNQVAEHVRRGGKAMQQQDGRRGWRPCFAVKDVEPIHIAPPVADRCIMNGHAELLWLCCRNHRLQVVEAMSACNHLNTILTVISTIG